MQSPLPRTSGIDLKPVRKAYDLELDKARPPQETVEWVSHRLSLFGAQVLREVKRIDTGRLDVPVYISLCGDEAFGFTSTKKQMGKGATPVQAEASALMELAERFSFFTFMKATSFPLLTPDQATPKVMPFSQAAKAVGHALGDLSLAQRVYNLLPQRWCWARNLSQNREEMIPLDWFYTINEFNGPAAGNCQEEAVLQAICEVVERHVSAISWLEERPTPAIDFASVDDPVARELIAKFQNAGIEVYLKDYTMDMGIPSVAALCWDPETFPHKSEIVYAAGTATSPSKALIRALTEVAQLAGDFHTASSYKVSALPKFTRIEEAAYVTRAEATVALGDLPDLSGDDFKAEVINCVEALSQRGFWVYTLDVTHPRLQVPTVYCFVPGFHFAHRTTGTDAIFHAAKLASQLPDPARAAQLLSAMRAEAGDSYYLDFFHALALMNLGRPQAALKALDAAMTQNPPARDAGSIHTQRGAALKDLERYSEAKAALNTAANYPEPHHEVFNLLGFCYFKLGEFEDAIAAFERAIEIEPGAAINYANIGTNLRELGKPKEAIAMYRHALELDPALDFARESLAKLRDTV